MRNLKDVTGYSEHDFHQLSFIEFCDDNGLASPEELGGLIVDAESNFPQKCWYSKEYVDQRNCEIRFARGVLKDLMEKFLCS